MLLKTYRAPDLASALAKAREELGPDALVLGTKEVSGRLGLRVVEVTVGAERREEPRIFAPDRVEPPAAAARSAFELPHIETAVRALVASGVSRDLATRFARIASQDLLPESGPTRLAEATVRGMESLLPLAPVPVGARCLFIVGPPGAGKTTTVAKLTARMSGDGKRAVFLAQADVERIGSLEQSEIFARHMGVVLARVDAPDDLLRAIQDAGPSGAVVVDTPGISASDTTRMRRLEALRNAVPDALVTVVLPAGLHREEASRVLERFAPLRPTCAAFSRVDDSDRVGELVSALAGSALPLAFVTNGHNVPDDLESVSPRSLAVLLLRSGRRGERVQEKSS